MRKIFTLIIICLGASAGAQNQGNANWTLERAVSYALENNLQVRRLDNSKLFAEANMRQAKNNRLPVLNGGTGLNFQAGRTIDPVTNQFESRNIFSQGYQLQGNLTLYNGGLIQNRYRQAEIDRDAAELDLKTTQNDIALQVANNYLNILLLREQLANARTQLALFDDQLKNTNALIDAGSVPVGERYNILSQQANANRNVIDLENQAQLTELNLVLLLELDPDQEFRVITPTLDLADEALFTGYSLNEVVAAARNTQPTIQAAQLRQSSAELEIEAARAGFRPTVGLFASLQTNFSSVAQDFDIEQTIVPTDVIINDQPVTIGFPQFGRTNGSNVPYFEQLNRNFGQSAGVNIQVPIYNRGQNNTNVQLAEIQKVNAGLDRELAENNLRNDVTRALGDLRAAQETYRAAQVAEEASRNAYEIAQRRYNAGASNSLDLVIATNNFQQAQTELSRTKYQLIFNREVIQFYLGQGLSLD